MHLLLRQHLLHPWGSTEMLTGGPLISLLGRPGFW